MPGLTISPSGRRKAGDVRTPLRAAAGMPVALNRQILEGEWASSTSELQKVEIFDSDFVVNQTMIRRI